MSSKLVTASFGGDKGRGGASTRRFAVYDWLEDPREAVADAAGVAEILFPSFGTWALLERLTIEADTTSAAAPFRLFVGAAENRNVRDGVSHGDLALGEYDPPLRVPAGINLRARWTGLNVGEIVHATAQLALARLIES